ncbi:Cofilin/tropomyosin-type actin-binding protein [Carpediemonas membranifera]|uniref:Cofilin/tropomyosin-type actin-binding protein n=1 Tax=Carpediemonas membranifera TaxID=201153 RepID=A0A8J6BYZ8_9EUKA|nr:Cofilin/tropomyosin-type actin-binding protein [Carpediemonas membranifera]|eukprot:KAG9395031.1 Cofilin/tropomyosin-type actin-binding protein [Carpediemonas membranifera]
MSIRTNIHCTAELKAAFEQSENTRAIFAKVVDEEVVLMSSVAKSSSDEEDYTAVLDSMAEECHYVLFHLDTDRWTLINFVPEETPVRAKMLASSVGDGLKKDLGLNLFNKDVHATEKADLSFGQLDVTLAPVDTSEALADSEKEVIAMERDAGEVAVQGASVMSFAVTDAAAETIRLFKGEGTDLVALNVTDDERVELLAKDTMPGLEGGMFLLRRVQGRAVFVMFVPETLPVKAKMVLTSAKGGLVAQVKALGLDLAKTIECREADTLEADIEAAVEPEADATMEYKPKFKRPARPGRRRV